MLAALIYEIERIKQRMTGVGAANPRENKAWLKDEWAEANDGKAE